MDTISLESNNRQVPGCSGQIRSAAVQSEQPDSNTPRRGYVWLKGSMMQFDYTETSQAVLILSVLYFNCKNLYGKPICIWTIKCTNRYTNRWKNYPIAQFINGPQLCLSYFDSILQSLLFLLRWTNSIINPLHKQDGQRSRLLPLQANTPSVRLPTSALGSLELIADYRLTETTTQTVLQDAQRTHCCHYKQTQLQQESLHLQPTD